MEKASVTELKQILLGALPAVLDDKQQSKKVSNILQAMKRKKLLMLKKQDIQQDGILKNSLELN